MPRAVKKQPCKHCDGFGFTFTSRGTSFDNEPHQYRLLTGTHEILKSLRSETWSSVMYSAACTRHAADLCSEPDMARVDLAQRVLPKQVKSWLTEHDHIVDCACCRGKGKVSMERLVQYTLEQLANTEVSARG